MEFDKESLKNAFASIEQERKEQFDEILEFLMAGGLTPAEEQTLKIRLEKNEDERNELLEMIRFGVFEGTPFEDSSLCKEIVNIPSTTRTFDRTEKSSRKMFQLIVCASILFVCFLGIWRMSFMEIDKAGSSTTTLSLNSNDEKGHVAPGEEKETGDGERTEKYQEELVIKSGRILTIPFYVKDDGQLALEELNAALREGGFEQPTNETTLLDYGFDLNGEIDVVKLPNDVGFKEQICSTSDGSQSVRSCYFKVVDNEATRRVERAFESVLEHSDESDETRLDYATFVLREEHNLKRAREILYSTHSESSRKHALLGVAYFMEGKSEQALFHFQSARSEDDLFEYILDEAICLTRLGRFREAVPLFIRATDKSDDVNLVREIIERLDKH